MKITAAQRSELILIASMEHMGGSCPLAYAEWRLREALRNRRLLKFNGRRRVRWDRTFYDITDAGRAALAQEEGGS